MKDKLIAALIAIGLTKGQAENYAELKSIENESEIPAIVEIVKGTIKVPESQSEIDRRVSEAVKTAVGNYEKKHNLKDGIQVETTPTPPVPPATPTPASTNPEIEALTKLVGTMAESINGLVSKNKAEERQTVISNALNEAKIPESMQKRFSISEEATPEELTQSITEFKQELTDLGVSGIIEPGGGQGSSISEVSAKKAAEQRNEGTGSSGGGVKGKKLM